MEGGGLRYDLNYMETYRLLVLELLTNIKANNIIDSKFTDMAKHAYEVLKKGKELRDDLYVCILTHSENTGDNLNPYYKIKTLGKLLDSVITLEGLFTYVLFTKVVRDEENGVAYKFLTNSDGSCTAKSPMGLFPDLLIDNDLDAVIKAIDEYNNAD